MPTEVESKGDETVDEAETPEGVGLRRAREVLGDLVARVIYGNERIVITKNGKQAAALVSMADLDRLNGAA